MPKELKEEEAVEKTFFEKKGCGDKSVSIVVDEQAGKNGLAADGEEQ